MLVFKRRRHEAIMIGDAEVRILRIGRDIVQVGIRAKPTIPVHRREIYDNLSEENRQAAALIPVPESLAVRLRRLVEGRTAAAARRASRPDRKRR